MTTPLRRRLRAARRWSGYLAALVLIAMALVAGAVSQLLPLAERHPDRVAAWLGERMKRPVAFDRVDTAWTRRGPLLRLDNLRIGGRDGIVVGDAEMLVSQYAGLLPGRSFIELRLRGLDLTLERDAAGRWRVRGLPGERPGGGDPLSRLEGLGELQVVDAKLTIDAPELGVRTTLPHIDLRLRVDGARVRAGVRARMARGDAQAGRADPEGDAPADVLDGVLEFRRDRGDGRAWVSAAPADLAQWSPLLRFAGVTLASGHGRAQAWAELRDHRVSAVTADVDLADVGLQGTAASAGTVPQVRLGRVAGRARWQKSGGGWRLDAPRLRIGDGRAAQSLDGLLLAGGRRYALAAPRIDAAPLLAVAALSDRLAPGLRRWVVRARPTATLHDVEVAGVRGGALRARARIEGFGFLPVDGAPGLRGLAGALEGDAAALAFRFDPKSRTVFDWPRGFGVAHPVALTGMVAGWREGGGWRAQTSALRIVGSDYSADVRGGLWFQGDGTRPRIDLAAALGPAPVVAGKKFWLRHSMSPVTVRWLDRALVGGMVRDGRAVVSGDLDDWPFRAAPGAPAKGLFHASARLDQAMVKFQADWPAAERLDAEVDFIADGFAVRGKGAIAGVGIGRIEAGIEHFGQARLKIDADGAGDAAQLLALLRRSPLQKTYGDTLANLEARGPAQVAFLLDQPLVAGGGPGSLRGTVALAGATLAEKRWDLAFDNVRGTARYGRGGFDAEALQVRHDGRPGRLSLRAGDDVRDPRQAFEAELAAALSADTLLARAPDLGWLRARIQGTSPWTIAVALPKAAAAAAGPSRLQLRSNLVGTALRLPAPLDKPAGAPLATTVDVDLPLGEGEIAVAFGNRMALRARSANGQTGLRVALGTGRVEAPPPASGLIATGRTDRLNAIEWAALATPQASPNGTAAGSGPALRHIDISAARLQMIGASFPDTRVRAVPAAEGTAVQLDGKALAGSLLLPRDARAALAGRLQRLHWRSAKPVAGSGTRAGSSAVATAAALADEEVDPAKVPPLNLLVDDLRFGDAQLGAASLRTQRTAQGMRIVQLQARAPGQAIDVTGGWSGAGAAARTRLNARLRSDDFGALLAGFGFGGQVKGGKGSAAFDAAWPGSPAGFRLAALQGRLTLDARDGQLVEIEPGAGRVLGLLSIAQLPRRLTLDFRDFFQKGFAFDRIGGEIGFGDAMARSDGLTIDGPAAEIRIRGAAHLREQTYDQTIDVFPKTGNLLTVAGAIAGGPVGAAIGAAANAVLKKPLGEMSAKRYRVTGPWKEPEVETVGRGEASSADAPPPG